MPVTLGERKGFCWASRLLCSSPDSAEPKSPRKGRPIAVGTFCSCRDTYMILPSTSLRHTQAYSTYSTSNQIPLPTRAGGPEVDLDFEWSTLSFLELCLGVWHPFLTHCDGTRTCCMMPCRAAALTTRVDLVCPQALASPLVPSSR